MKYKVSLDIGFYGAVKKAEIDVDDEDLADCETEFEKDRLIAEYAQDWANGHINLEWEPA